MQSNEYSLSSKVHILRGSRKQKNPQIRDIKFMKVHQVT